jgi:hypothetical protein
LAHGSLPTAWLEWGRWNPICRIDQLLCWLMRGINEGTGEQSKGLCWCADFSSWRMGLWRHVWSLRWWQRASRLLTWWRENHMSTFTWKNMIKKVGHASILHSWWQAAALLFSMLSHCM